LNHRQTYSDMSGCGFQFIFCCLMPNTGLHKKTCSLRVSFCSEGVVVNIHKNIYPRNTIYKLATAANSGALARTRPSFSATPAKFLNSTWSRLSHILPLVKDTNCLRLKLSHPLPTYSAILTCNPVIQSRLWNAELSFSFLIGHGFIPDCTECITEDVDIYCRNKL